MPTTSRSKTYSRKSTKRRAEEPREELESKRRKFDQDGQRQGGGSTDVEEDTIPRLRTPRDLTQIFEEIPPPVASQSQRKLAKRMLSRSRTEPSIASRSSEGSGLSSTNTSKSSMSQTQSLADPFAIPKFSASISDPKPGVSESKSGPTARGKNVGRTYAGSSRSFLVPIPSHSASLEQIQDELDDEFASRESYSSLRTRWGVDASEDDPFNAVSPARSGSRNPTPNASPSKRGKARPEPVPLENGMMNPLKSITELRHQGESRRFLDEVGYLWEGLDPSGGVGLRRASALEIVSKLGDSEFSRKAKAADFIGPTWDLFLEAGSSPGQDPIMGILAAFYLSLIARDPALLSELDQRSAPPLSTVLFRHLGCFSASDPLAVTDVIELRKLGLSKKDLITLGTIRSAISAVSLFQDAEISAALLISHSLAALPASALQPTAVNVNTVLSTLKSVLSSLSSSPKLDHVSLPYDHLFNLLSLLDSHVLSAWAPQTQDDAFDTQALVHSARDWLPEGLLSLCISLETRPVGKARACAPIALRLLVGLTHSDKIWCTRLIEDGRCLGFIVRSVLRHHSNRLDSSSENLQEENLIKREESEDQQFDASASIEQTNVEDALDMLCLTLGLLTNLVQVDEQVKDAFRTVFVSPKCVVSRCLVTCKCSSGRVSSLEAFLRVYRELLAQSDHSIKQESQPAVPDPDTLLAAGETRLLLSHLSLLFGLLMLDNPPNRRILLENLPTTSRRSHFVGESAKVDMLMAHAKEFAYIYRDGDSKTSEEAENVRLVLLFLTTLRDSS